MNGPSVTARGPQVAVAWFTKLRGEKAQVSLTFSTDGGTTYGLPFVVDESEPIGRPDVEFLADGSVVVVWIATVDGAAALRARRFFPGGSSQAAITVAEVDPSRGSGFPTLAAVGDGALVTWTDTEGEGRVRAVVLELE